MLLKYCTQHASKFGKLSSGHRTGKGQFSLRSERKAMPKNAQTTAHCTHFTCEQGHAEKKKKKKSFKLGFSSIWTKNFQKYKLDLEKAEEPEIKLPTSIGLQKKQENSRKKSTSASLTVWITINCEKFFKRWEYQTTLPTSGETCMQVKKQPLEPDMEQ